MLIIRRLNCIDAASSIVLCKQVSYLGLLEYNLLHCLETPSDIFQLSPSGVIDLLYMLSRMGVHAHANALNIVR
jgi:hypothetical protein